jgi:hypothetical protein
MSLPRSSGATLLRFPALGALLALAASACSSSNTQPPIEGTGDDGGASSGGSGHPALPQVDDNGGGILPTPEIVTVTFSPSLYTNASSPDATTMIADLLDFDDTLTQSAYWDTVRAGYCEPVNSTNCVGHGVAIDPTKDHVSITTAPAASYTDAPDNGPSTLHTYFNSLLAANILPAPNANTLYVFYFPQSTAITVNGGTTCSNIGGFHNSLTVGSMDVPYAIVTVCDPEDTSQGATKLTVEQTATFGASHEIMESVTDPHIGELPTTSNIYQQLAFDMTNTANQAWPLVLGGGEVADLCLDIIGGGQDRATSGKYTVQRIWNNPSAAAGHDPCVPIPSGQVYFNVAPPAADDQLEIAVGGTTAFNATAFADGKTDPWNVELVDVGQAADGSQSTVLTTSPSTNAATNAGDAVACSITLNSSPPLQPGEQQGDPGFEPYVLVSFDAAGTYHLWPGIVAAQ